MGQKRLYPLGIQDFETVIKDGFVYIDKTATIYDLVSSGARYVFLSRPRRFGKSLLVSTLKAYFEGRKDLFEGFEIGRFEKDWTKYPVLLISLAAVKGTSPRDLWSIVNSQFVDYEAKYDIKVDDEHLGARFSRIVKKMHEVTGQRVVVLIDEYDSPMLNVVHDDEKRTPMREALQSLYGPLKDLNPMLRFTFITGITKFSQMSIFSTLNNISNISMTDRYANIVGISKDELLSQMSIDISQLADSQRMTFDQTTEKLRQYYDGYKFSKECPDIFNPYSLLFCFEFKEFKPYWFESGTPTHLIQMMRKHDVLPSNIGPIDAAATDFDRPTESLDNAVPLLYQSGYLTIKNYDPIFESYILDIPNHEVRIGLMESLLPYYVAHPMEAKTSIRNIFRAIHSGDMQLALERLGDFIITIPQCNDTNYEGHWQQVLYVIFSLFGLHGDVEVHTSTGRVNMLLKYMNRLYLFELKINKSPESAMAQIEDKEYPSRFKLLGLPIMKVGLNLNTDTRRLAWLIKE